MTSLSWMLAVLGLVRITARVFSFRATKGFASSSLVSGKWAMYRTVAIVSGVIFGIASWIFVGFVAIEPSVLVMMKVKQ